MKALETKYPSSSVTKIRIVITFRLSHNWRPLAFKSLKTLDFLDCSKDKEHMFNIQGQARTIKVFVEWPGYSRIAVMKMVSIV